MGYYINGKPIGISKRKNFLNSGSEGKIYKIDNKIYKIYYASHIESMSLTTLTCHKDMTKIRTSQIILPTDLVYDDDERCCGYVNEFIEGNPDKKFGITKMSSNKFIKNLEILEEDATILGKNLILMRDINFDNYLYNENTETMYLLDSSRYTRKSNLKNEDYISKNINQLNLLIEELLLLDFKKFKPIKTFLPRKRAKCLINCIKEKKEVSLYSEFFKTELQGYENVYEYAKSLKR